jgi:hypothetical protein
MARVEMELRNLNREYIMNYLREIGGEEVGELRVQGNGWTAWLEEMEPAVIITMRVRRDMLTIESEHQETLDHVHTFMRQKTMRGGG